MIEYQNINKGESGLSVRAKLNKMFSALITGSEGVNQVWVQMQKVLNSYDDLEKLTEAQYEELKDQVLKSFDYMDMTAQDLITYINAINGGVAGFADNTEYNPNIPEDKAATIIAIGPGTYTYFKDADGVAITITEPQSFTVFYKGENSNYWKHKTINLEVTYPPITQELGDSETAVMSQKAVSEKLSDISSEVKHIALVNGESLKQNNGWINSNGYVDVSRGKYIRDIGVLEGQTITYEGSYGGAAVGWIFYDISNNIISYKTKTDLGFVKEQITIPNGCVKISVSSYNDTLNLVLDGNNPNTYIGKVEHKEDIDLINKKIEEVNSETNDLNSSVEFIKIFTGILVEKETGWFNSSGYFNNDRGKAIRNIEVNESQTFIYTGSYGGSCVGWIFYNNEGGILSVKSKENLGVVSEKIVVPTGAVKMSVCSFTDTLNLEVENGIPNSYTHKTEFEEEKKSLSVKFKDIDRRFFNTALYPSVATEIGFINTNGQINEHDTSNRTKPFLVKGGDVLVYKGSYGGSAAGIVFFDADDEVVSVVSKTDVGIVTEEIQVPDGAHYAIASSFNNPIEIYYKNGLVDDVKSLEKELQGKTNNADFYGKTATYNLFYKFDKANGTNIAKNKVLDSAILFSAFVPNPGYENDEIYMIALSAYYNTTSSEMNPTRYDVWVHNQTRGKDVYQYINKDVNNQSRFMKVYKESEYGTLYMLIDTDVVKSYNENGTYKAILFGQREYAIAKSSTENPFLNPIIWDSEEDGKVFSIAWFGTSIPAGAYPKIVGEILGVKVYNEAVGESLVRLGWGKNCIADGDNIDIWGCSGTDTSKWNPISNTITALAKSMSASIEEKEYYLNHLSHFERICGGTLDRERYTDDIIKGFSYENKLLKYIDSSRNDYTPIDLLVFDHGHNDLNPDGDPLWNTYDIANRDKDNYWGAMNFLMDIIRKYNPHQNVCQISHYQGNVDYSANFYKAQQQFAEHWGIPFMELYKLTQMSTSEKVRTNGWWGYTDGLWHNEGLVFRVNADGTFTTNQSCVIQYDFGIAKGTYDSETQLFTSSETILPTTTNARNVQELDGITTMLLSPRELYMKDRLHPASDLSGTANNRIARLLASWINSTYLYKSKSLI